MYKHTYVFISCLVQASAIFSSFGSEFLLALPKIMNDHESGITFFMVAKLVGEVDVALTSPNFQPEAQGLNEMIALLGKRMYTGVITRRHFSNVLLGFKPTYRFNGNGLFSLSVMLSEGGAVSASTFQALPIDCWDTKYLAVTLTQFSSVQVISNVDSNSVTVKLNLNGAGNSMPTFEIDGKKFNDGSELRVTLDRWQAYSISFCDIEKEHTISLTGSIVRATFPIGVVSGNCRASSKLPDCTANGGRVRGSLFDSVTEMLMPERLFGTIFVIASTGRRRTIGTVLIVSSTDQTHVTIYTDAKGKTEKINITHAGDLDNSHRLTGGSSWLVSDKKVQVMMLLRATCLAAPSHELIGGSAITSVIPNSHFSTEYQLMFPDSTAARVAMVVAEHEHRDDLELDGTPLQSRMTWVAVFGNAKYDVADIDISQRSSVIASPHHHRFGCYLLGYSNSSQYMHAAGFEGCVDTVETMKPEDNIDNDCDSRVDEERLNQEDDDADGRMDEDLGKTNIVDGAWGAWQAWACYPNCSYRHFYRIRHCNSPPPSIGGLRCPGTDHEFLSQTCQQNISCPVSCQNFTWGERCEKTCGNCDSPCDPANGSCPECKLGFKRPELGCTKACGHNEFGKNCQGDCVDKCGGDCVDRKTGECPEEGNSYVIYAPLLLVIPVTMLLVVVSRRHYNEEEE